MVAGTQINKGSKLLVPARSSVAELLDGPVDSQSLLSRNLRDMARANHWLGSQRAVIQRVARWVQPLPIGVMPSVLDVGTGNAALPSELHRWGKQHGRSLHVIACDISGPVLGVAQAETCSVPISLLRCDARALPFADASIDIVTCVQTLHHFSFEAAEQVLRELARVARLGVIVSDLRRSYPAYWGARLLAYGPVSRLSRHDGPLSVLRAYTSAEVEVLVERASLRARVRRAWAFRVEVEVDKTDSPVPITVRDEQELGITLEQGFGKVATKRKQPKGKTMATTPETTEQHAGLSNEQLIDMYRQMVLIRNFEEKCQEMYTRAKIGGFLHLYSGQEAVAVGTAMALKPEDHMITHYRDHGHAIARGLDVNPLMAELFGKATGCAAGLGGSMHLVDVSKNFWGGYAIVGSHLLMACGIGTAIKLQKKAEVIMVYFGDGATNGGEFYESLNFSQLWKLPVVFVCENNLFAMGTPIGVHTSVQEIYRKACAFDMTSERVDGNDPIATYEATKRAVEHARSGEGPVLLEALTYRFRGHSAQDTQKYRTKEEVEQYRLRDPNQAFRKKLIDEGILSEEQAQQIEEEASSKIDASVEFADQSPPADEKWLTSGVYAKDIPDKY
jgi:pyruvate dehydrogenase E1 component alpha subunit